MQLNYHLPRLNLLGVNLLPYFLSSVFQPLPRWPIKEVSFLKCLNITNITMQDVVDTQMFDF